MYNTLIYAAQVPTPTTEQQRAFVTVFSTHRIEGFTPTNQMTHVLSTAPSNSQSKAHTRIEPSISILLILQQELAMLNPYNAHFK
ncbi:hypothetical protein HO173_007366 [Letharia columbiana]|uniref:Uncharacterized protein n=1 Tax=Letharia columbiana TaxID=112416 RepID=A0A8H6FTD1_9LECA|nr:uncharacterized protein HO173_007366 [Letharia columbiana]KAF6234333.1 hypothetical protein HO173_007366 [Letharia columbiana]